MSNLLLELMREVRQDVSELKEDVSEMKHDVKQNTEDLTEHKAGVITARKLISQNKEESVKRHELIDLEIAALKKPKEIRKVIWQFAVDTGRLAGSLAAVYGLYKLLF